jgi:hypothetical protein
MNIKTRISTAIATGAVLVNALAPVTLAQELTVTGNGAFSDNTIKVETNNATVVDQSNDANVTNNITSNASTGGNSASYNTGGDTHIVTGDAATLVDVSTAVNMNKAVLHDCGTCESGDLHVKVTGNGAFSDNNVKVEKENLVSVSQDNNAYISNYVDANANTGKNDSSFNTGGDSIIKTGEAITLVDVDNKANENMAKIGGGHSSGTGHSLVEISGNGAFSDNKAKLDMDSAVVLDQYNHADVYNDIHSKANTGKNDATFNTGGITAVLTGHASTLVDVDNKVNFNHASVDCDCVLEDLKVKISGNGAESYNKVRVENEDELFNYQDNYAYLHNNVDGHAKTGYNDVSFSTGDVYGDPFIKTGNSLSVTDVSNTGNVNLFNEGHSLHLPGNWEISAHFDLHDLMSFLHLG